MRLKAFVTLIIVSILLSISLSANAVTWYVSTTGSNSDNGRGWDQPFLNVGYALFRASAGDQVWVAKGTYHECITMKAGVDLYGGFIGDGTENFLNDRPAFPRPDTDPNETILHTDGIGGIVVTAQTARIDGFTIEHGTGMPLDAGGMKVVSCYPTIVNNKITQNVGYNGFLAAGIYVSGVGTPVIRDNQITSNYGQAIYCGSYSTAQISNNVIKGNTKEGISCSNSSPTITNNIIVGNGRTGILCSSGTPVITNNTITGNSIEGIKCSNSSPTISNNIVVFNSSGITNSGTGVPELDHNCVFGNTTIQYSLGLDPGVGAIPVAPDTTVEPLFVDSAAGDYHLQSDSPCKGAGNNSAPGLPTTDMDGDARVYPTDGTVDIGADEALEETSLTFYPDGGGTYSYTIGVKITCLTGGVTIRYTVDGTEPTETSTVYDKGLDGKGVVVVPHTLTLKARAYKDGVSGPIKTAVYTFDTPPGGGGGPVPYAFQANHITMAANPVKNLIVQGIYMPDTVNISWTSDAPPEATFSVARKVNGSPEVSEPNVGTRNWIDVYGGQYPMVDGTTYEYSVQVNAGANEDKHVTEGLPYYNPATYSGDGRNIYHHKVWTASEPTTITMTPDHIVADDAQAVAVDSRLDMRSDVNTPLDFKFKQRTYRGGLFVGHAKDPDPNKEHSGTGRSFIKFQLPEMPAGTNLWTASVSAYYTGAFGTQTANINCQLVSDDSWSVTGTNAMKWTTQPGVDSVLWPACSVSQPTAPGWCNWSFLKEIGHELIGDRTLSARLSSAYLGEDKNTWAYFAKHEYDATKAPTILLAYGASKPTVVDLAINPTSVTGGTTVAGTVTVCGTVPAQGFNVDIGLDPAYAYVVRPVTIPQGSNAANFTLSTHVLRSPEPTSVQTSVMANGLRRYFTISNP